MPDLDELLGLGRLGPRLPGLGDHGLGAHATNPYSGPERRRRRRRRLTDDAGPELNAELLERIRTAPPEAIEDQPHGALQWALETLDLPRNAIANVVNQFVGAKPVSKRRAFGMPKVSGQDILKHAGLSFEGAEGQRGKGSAGGKVVDFLAGFLGDVALDPLTYATFGTGKLLGSAAQQVGKTRLTKAGAAALENRAAKVLERVGRRSTKHGLEAHATRDATAEFLERLGEAPRRKAWEKIAAKDKTLPRFVSDDEAVEAAAKLREPLRPLGREYARERGGELLRERLAARLVKQSPELEDTARLGLTTRGLKEFNPLGLATLPLIPMSLFAPRTAGKLAAAAEPVLRATRPILNPLSMVLPAKDITLLRAGAKGLGDQGAKGILGKAAARLAQIPGVNQIGQGLGEAGRALRGKFSTEPLPPRAGDAADEARYETEKFERWARQRTERAQRGVLFDEPKKFDAWIKPLAKDTGLPESTIGEVIADVGERLRAWRSGQEPAADLAESVRLTVRRGGGTDEQARKLVEAIGPRAEADLAPEQEGTPEFNRWFGDSKVRDETGKPRVVYHGSQRPDRIGNRFQKGRATSGPMAFFTADQTIAGNYSKGKADTSLEVGDWSQQYSMGSGRSAAKGLDQVWHRLPPEQQALLRERLPLVGYNGDTDTYGIGESFEPLTSRDHFEYTTRREARGNSIRGAFEIWVNGGNLHREEERFIDVIRAAGGPELKFDDPHGQYPGVFPVYLSIRNPLVTHAIPPETMAALEQQARRQPPARHSIGADAWDKNTRDPRDWIASLKEDAAKGANSHVWTSIPDWVTRTLKKLGYDGIHDTGGKLGGDKHDVWIPFEPTQIKSATGNRGTFDPKSPRIDLAPEQGGLFGAEPSGPRTPARELNLWGEPVSGEVQGALFSRGELEKGRRPEERAGSPYHKDSPNQDRFREPVEITDTLRGMVARVMAENIPGRKRPGVDAVRKALIDRYGSAAVGTALKRVGSVRAAGSEAELEEAIDQATRGMRLFDDLSPPATETGGTPVPPDLAPARRTLGERVSMIDSDRNEYAGTLEIVDADALLSSHRPVKSGGKITRIEPREGYPEGFQARVRTDEKSVAQIAAIAGKPRYDELLEFGLGVTEGPPVTAVMQGRDTVIQGNGRVAGMLGWSKAQWKEYRAALAARGIDVPAGVEKPVLVRRLKVEERAGSPYHTDLEAAARKLAALGQESAALKQSRIEQARAALNAFGAANIDAVPPVTIREPVTRDNALATLENPANREFKEWLLGGLTPERRKQFLAAPDEVAEKLGLVFLGMLPRRVQELAARLPAELENMFAAAAPQAAWLHSLARSGAIRAEYDLYPALEQGAEWFARPKNKRGGYANIIRDLDEIAETGNLPGIRDDVADLTQRGLAVAVGMVKASRAANPTEVMLDSLSKVIAAAKADDPNQIAMFAIDPRENAAKAYLEAFLPPAQAQRVLASMGTIGDAEAGKRVVAKYEGMTKEELRAQDALTPEQQAAQIRSGLEAHTPDGLEASTTKSPDRVALEADIERVAAERGHAPEQVALWKRVIEHFSDDAIRGLRTTPGSAEEFAAIEAGAGMRPAASYHFGDTLSAPERAQLGAAGVIKLFNRGAREDDVGLWLEEAWHHVYRNVLSDAERNALAGWHAQKTPDEWATWLGERAGPRSTPEMARYYARDANELASRLFADHVMGREISADPAMKSIFVKAWDALLRLWQSLTGQTRIAPEIEALFERFHHVAGDGPRGVPAGAKQRELLRVGEENLRPARDKGVSPEAAGVSPPPPGAPQLPLPYPEKPRGGLKIADPVREAAEYLEARSAQRVREEQAAGVRSPELTTQRDIGYLLRLMIDDPKTKLGGLMRKAGMSKFAGSQLARDPKLREKFTSELDRVLAGAHEALSGKRAATAEEQQAIEALGLRPGEIPPRFVLDPVLRHVARELDSVRTIGSTEFLREIVRRHGVRLGGKGAVAPPGYVQLKASVLGDIEREFAFPKEVAAVLEKHIHALQKPDTVLRNYRSVLNLWKGMALMAPAYHLRNLLGNVWNAHLVDGFHAEAWALARDMQRAAANGGDMQRKIAGTQETFESLYRKLVVDHGLIGSGFYGFELRVNADRTREMIDALKEPASWRKAGGELRGWHAIKSNQAVGQIAEEMSRIGLVITRLRRGDSLADAVSKTRKALFDYGDLTDFERGTATTPGIRDFVPFYTWTRKNAALLATVMLTSDGLRKLAGIPKLQSGVEQSLVGDEALPDSLRPKHIMAEGGVQVAGGVNPQFVGAGYMLPIGELGFNPLAPAQAIRKGLEQVGGPAKTALELATNYDTFFDRPITEYPEQRKEMLGVPLPPAAKHVLRAVRPLNQVEQIREQAAAAETPGGAALGVGMQLAGVRTRPVSVTRQVFERERADNEEIGAVRRDMRRRIGELQAAGQPIEGDAELRRLAGVHEEIKQRRDALPLRQAREIARPMSARRREMLAGYLDEFRMGNGE